MQSFSIGNGAHAAQSGVKPRQDDNQNRADPEAVQTEQIEFRQQYGKDNAPGENADCDFCYNVSDKRNQRQEPARAGRESFFQKFRHRINFTSYKEGDKHPRQNKQTPGVEFKVRHLDAVRTAGTGKPDKVFRPDVRGENRRADDKPAKRVSRQEVVFGCVAGLENDPPRKSKKKQKVTGDYAPVECRQRVANG